MNDDKKKKLCKTKTKNNITNNKINEKQRKTIYENKTVDRNRKNIFLTSRFGNPNDCHCNKYLSFDKNDNIVCYSDNEFRCFLTSLIAKRPHILQIIN